MAATSSSAISYLPIRSLSGQFAANGAVTSGSVRRKNWKPDRASAWVESDGKPTVPLVQFVDYISEKVLGGSNNKTLPQVESLITYSQAQALFVSLLSAAQAQQANANAQALASVIEVVKATGAAGASQIPAVQLNPVDVTPPVFGETGGGAGGD